MQVCQSNQRRTVLNDNRAYRVSRSEFRKKHMGDIAPADYLDQSCMCLRTIAGEMRVKIYGQYGDS